MGVFAVAAPFDDYAELVGYHREKLPLVEGELGPYYMGFYATRPEVKRRVREAARPFFLAEVFAPLAGEGGRAALEAARPAFELLLRANHHDFVTGTSNDAVVSTEQLPLCALVEEAGQRALAAVLGAVAARLSPAAPGDTRVVVFNGSGGARTELLEVALPTAAVGTSGGVAVRAGGRAVTAEALPCPAAGCGDRRTLRLLVEALAPFAWRTVELRPEPVSTAPSPRVTLARLDAAGQPATGAAVRRVVLQSERVRAVFDGAGFALVSLQVDGREALRGPSFVDGAYLDTGGLWRLGHEMEGCVFSPLEPPVGADAVSVEVLEVGPLRVRVAFRGASGVVREAALEAGAPGLDLALTAAAENHTSRTLSFDFAAGPGAALRTSTPGGFTERVPEYVYAPTFWPAPGWAAAGEWTVLLRQATGVRFSAEGALELLTVRNAPSEQCDYEGGTGTDFEAHRLEWRVVSAAGPGEAERASQAYNRPLQAALVPAAVPTPASSLPDEGALLSLAGEGVVTALKPAYDGDGLVVRALLGAGPLTVTVSPLLGLARASRADVVERDLGALPLAGGVVTLDAATLGSVATVRLRSPPSAR